MHTTIPYNDGCQTRNAEQSCGSRCLHVSYFFANVTHELRTQGARSGVVLLNDELKFGSDSYVGVKARVWDNPPHPTRNVHASSHVTLNTPMATRAIKITYWKKNVTINLTPDSDACK